MGRRGVPRVDRRLRGARRPHGLAGLVLLQPRHAARARAASTPTGSAPRGRGRVLLMLYALRGTPFVYQGEELGLPDAEVPPERVVDVDGRDPERAPIPWRPSEAGPGAGFTDGEPWLPLVADAETLYVERQAADPRSTLALTRRLAALRARRARAAGRRPAAARPRPGRARVDARRRAFLAAVNFAAEPVDVALPDGRRLDAVDRPAREAPSDPLAPLRGRAAAPAVVGSRSCAPGSSASSCSRSSASR